MQITLSTNYPAEVANLLEKTNATVNDGRGSSVCRAVIQELRLSNIASARSIADLDFDKVRQYPELAELFRQVELVTPCRI